MEHTTDHSITTLQFLVEVFLFTAVISAYAVLIYSDVTGNLTVIPEVKVGLLYFAIFVLVALVRFFSISISFKSRLLYWIMYIPCTVIMWYCGFAGALIIVNHCTILLSNVLTKLFC